MASRRIPELMKKKLLQEARMECPFCGERDVSTFEIHHIQPYSEVKEHRIENLILMCSSCHSKATANELTESSVLRMKLSLVTGQHPGAKREHGSSNVINLQEVRNSGVIANVANIKTTNRKVVLAPAEGTIASSLNHRNYTKYLIDRYHKFKREEVGKADMNYSIFYGAITRKFGAKWDLLPLHRFDELCTYIQVRIDKTILGKKLKSSRRKRFSTYSEYLKKHS